MRTPVKVFIAIILTVSTLFCHILITSIVKALDLIEPGISSDPDIHHEIEPEASYI